MNPKVNLIISAPGKNYYATTAEGKLQLSYMDKNTTVVIPAGKNKYSGKFDVNACKDYYTAEEKVYTTRIEGEPHFSIKTKYRKDANPERYNTIYNSKDVGDIIEFEVEYHNIYPEPVPYGTTTINSFAAKRIFLFSNATTDAVDKITYMQEFLPTVTLNGIEYKDVYHLYLKQPTIEAYEPRSEKYPLDFVHGIYLSKGTGIVHAYTLAGKQLTVTVE